jgi:hypothetical protein
MLQHNADETLEMIIHQILFPLSAPLDKKQSRKRIKLNSEQFKIFKAFSL